MATFSASEASSFDPKIVLASYPLPIARTYQSKLVESRSRLHRLFGLIDVFEVALKYCAIIAIQEYVRLGVRSEAVDEEVALHFRRPHLGNWNAFLREILRSFHGRREQLFMPALVDLYFDPRGRPHRRQERINQLISLRNRDAHGALMPDQDAEQELRTHEPLLESLLLELNFLASYELTLHHEDGSARLLMGIDPKTIALPVAASEVEPGQLCLVRDQAVLPLSPLLLYARCDVRTDHGPCARYKTFFFNGLMPRPDFLDYWMSHHRRGVDLSERLRGIVENSAGQAGLASPEGASATSWELLQERSDNLVGRVDEEVALLSFVTEQPRGFLVVEGDPGIGKTALLSRTVHDLLGHKAAYGRSDELGALATSLHEARLHIAFHLCGADKSSQELLVILSSLINQLPARGASATVVASDLANAARATVEKTRGKLLLMIDGVDEALAGRSEDERENLLSALLFRGERLPTSVYVLLGARRGAIPALRDADVPALKLELSGLAKQEIRRLLIRVVSRYELQDHHIEAIARVSAGNPLYIRMLAEDLVQGRLYLEDVEQLPQGIEGYFEKLLLRFASSSRWPVLRDTLLLLSIAHGFLTAEQISAITGVSQAAVENALDNELGALLSEAENSKRQPIFQLFHAKFREFMVALFSGKIPATAKRMNEGRTGEPTVSSAHLERMRREILDYCGKWASIDDTYPLRYYSGHLYESGANQQLEKLLTGTNFLSEKVRRLDDPFLAADDVSYLVRVLLQSSRDAEIVALATRDEAFYRDGIASGLRAAAGISRGRTTAIVQQLLDVSRLGAAGAFFGRELPLPAMNARRVAIEVAYHFSLGDKLKIAALDRSRPVRILTGPYLYRFWQKEREPGWELLDHISEGMVLRAGLPIPRRIESCTVMSVMIMAHHYDQPEVLSRLRQPWSENVNRLERLKMLFRPLVPAALFFFQYALRHMLAAQADFQPLNLEELIASFRVPRQIASRKLGLECLAEMENVDRGCERTIAVLLDRQVAFDVFLMQVVERVLFVHGCRDPERIIDGIWRIYREGCPWFHQSALYTTFHILRNHADARENWLESYRTMTRRTIAETRAIFATPNKKKYPLLPHMGWAEIIFDQHRPSSKAQFIPQFYREALALGDMEYARRALRAAGVLSHSYDRHDLALLSLEAAVKPLKPELRETVVDLLANIRFLDEAAVNHFVSQHADADLTTRVISATPSIRSVDTFNWIDNFVNAQLISSEEFRVKVAGAYRSAGEAKSLSQGMDRVLAWVMNQIAGHEAVEVGGSA